MKGTFLAAMLAATPSIAFAQQQTFIGYIEGSIGANFAASADTKTTTLIVPPDTATGRAEVNYGANLIVGAESGLADLTGDGNWRAGLSYEYTRFELDSVRVNGTVNGLPGSIEFNEKAVNNAGYNFDNSVHLLMANGYYNLPAFSDAWRAYIGAGVGGAIIENANTQFAFNATAGFRVALTSSSYVGMRYRFYWIDGPRDSAGIRYNPITTHTISAVLGFYVD